MGVDSPQINLDLNQLITGLEKMPAGEKVPSSAESEMAVFDALFIEDWMFWVWLGLFGVGAVAWSVVGRMWWKERFRDLAKWSQLSHYLETGENISDAVADLEQIEVLSSLLLPDANNAHRDWFQLSSSEKVVARGILSDVSAKEIAEELVCTPSHVYNLRSRIRKKWGIDSNQALRQAISERMPKER